MHPACHPQWQASNKELHLAALWWICDDINSCLMISLEISTHKSWVWPHLTKKNWHWGESSGDWRSWRLRSLNRLSFKPFRGLVGFLKQSVQSQFSLTWYLLNISQATCQKHSNTSSYITSWKNQAYQLSSTPQKKKCFLLVNPSSSLDRALTNPTITCDVNKSH